MALITTERITITILYLKKKLFFYCERTTFYQSYMTEVAQLK